MNCQKGVLINKKDSDGKNDNLVLRYYHLLSIKFRYLHIEQFYVRTLCIYLNKLLDLCNPLMVNLLHASLNDA
jgi:hypothetical protein